MNSDLKAYINQWFIKAGHDIETAKLLIELRPLILDVACFHCQQAIEKYLKAFLIANNKSLIKTHSIEFLIQECAAVDSDFSNLNFKNLDEYAVDIRYPDSFLEPDITETKEYYTIALQVQKLVFEKVTLSE